jgi:AraC-like DNA-binding protein
MLGFADRTGLTTDRPPDRYLWTDAFAVCKFLGLGRTDLARRLVDQVHQTLGRHHANDARRGWISGLESEQGEQHPTIDGLRISRPYLKANDEAPVDVLPNRLYVDDGDILTSAGVTTGIDLSLHLIRRDFGSAAANTRARGLVAPPQRQGGQAQFNERLMPDASGHELGPLRDWMLENLAVPLDLGTLATRAHMSRRTLSRRFREETGMSPMAWLADARIDRAREILETTTEPVENIGRLTGLGAPVSVRAAFHRRIGISPKEYRAVWRGSSSSSANAGGRTISSAPDHEAALRPAVSRTDPRRGTASTPARVAAWTRVPGSLAKP